MKSRFQKSKDAAPPNSPPTDVNAASAVVEFTDPRYGRSHKQTTQATLIKEIEEARELLDRGLTGEAETRLRNVIAAASARQNASILAEARCALSEALYMFGRYRESLEVISIYETPEARAAFETELAISLRVQLGLAYNYTGDHPKAIALLNATLQHELTEGGGSDAHLGAIYNALARVYRNISEHTIARDHVHKALEHYRRTGDWRGLSEAYFGLAIADTQEGEFETALDNYKQALKLVGHRPAPYLLGKIYGNMAGVCWYLRRPHDGIAYLEKAINYYERTDHTANAAIGYNNLGINLILIGKWGRAHEVLTHALSVASEANENSSLVPTILESLGELQMLRGNLEEAQSLLERAVKLAIEGGNKWYAVQAMRTLCRCHLGMKDTASALVKGEGALALAERIGDRQAICESSLLLAEAYLQEGSTEECAGLLQKVLAETADTSPDLAMAGETQRICGMLALKRDDPTLAANHFGKCISIFEMIGDRYRTATAHYWLGLAYSSGAIERAREHLALAANIFKELGARNDLTRTQDALDALAESAPAARPDEVSTLSQLLTLRLAEAVASRELLLRELAAVLHQETGARRVLIAEAGEDERPRVIISHGCSAAESARIAEAVVEMKSDAERIRYATEHNATVVQLKSMNAAPVMLFLAPRGQEVLPGGASIEPLLRVVELGMDVCALRARAKTGRDTQSQDTLAGASLMPGFIHSSPAMTRLVDEVHKIRSSDVTVLVTGESGTGKELVARAIHALSTRRSKVFVPFNCTAVPKELTEGYLFGYRRGAFTGAVADSPGVIRAAIGGTLFLDEIGDLPLDVQPKLLRFLQEGEVQPLGEQRPSKVDVRIIAATNSDLERMVAEGRFREDLYYRLNVIRLNVPPLRERRSEIPTIVNYYLNHYSAKFGRHDIQITPQAVDLLMVSDWPGNVRQLCNEIQRVVARSEDGTVINPDNLSPELRHTSVPVASHNTVTAIGAATAAIAADASKHGMTLADALAELERRMISEALQKHSGNISRAARELGLTRRGLYLKLERYQMSLSA